MFQECSLVGGLGSGVVLCRNIGFACNTLGTALVAHLRLIHCLAAAERSCARSAELLLNLDALEVLLIF